MHKSLTDSIEESINEVVSDLIANNVSGIAQELADAADGKIGIGITIKLVKTTTAIHCQAAVAYSRKFKDETETIIRLEDPNQTTLGLNGGDR